jgi:hypothetical protein
LEGGFERVFVIPAKEALGIIVASQSIHLQRFDRRHYTVSLIDLAAIHPLVQAC